jgi:metallo-beta-lactamase class B
MPRLARALASLLLLAAAPGRAAPPASWTAPIAPFRVAGNLYYVGSRELASWLVTTPEGHVLINSNLEESVPQSRASIEALGFKLADVKVLLISQAHFDHVAGSAALLKLTGARYMVMDADVPVVESGGKADFAYSAHRYPAALARARAGAKDAFVDPAGYRKLVEESERDFQAQLAAQKAAAAKK